MIHILGYANQALETLERLCIWMGYWKGQLIYLTRKGSFQVKLYKMIRFLSGKLKKHTKLAKIVKISEIFNQLVFPLNFNRFCHPMTFIWIFFEVGWNLKLNLFKGYIIKKIFKMASLHHYIQFYRFVNWCWGRIPTWLENEEKEKKDAQN